MKIIQLSDLHITQKGKVIYNTNSRKNLLSIIEQIKQIDFDFVVLSGDLVSDDLDPELYRYTYENIKTLNKPFYICPGNHDRVNLITENFDYEILFSGDQMYYSITRNDITLIFLDTSRNILSKEQYDFITTTTKNNPESMTIIFMHHPPIYLGCQFMDNKYALDNIGETTEFFTRLQNIHAIFCGHYHANITTVVGNTRLYTCPAVSFQIDPASVETAISSPQGGYRIITIEDNTITTECLYLDN